MFRRSVTRGPVLSLVLFLALPVGLLAAVPSVLGSPLPPRVMTTAYVSIAVTFLLNLIGYPLLGWRLLVQARRAAGRQG